MLFSSGCLPGGKQNLAVGAKASILYAQSGQQRNRSQGRLGAARSVRAAAADDEWPPPYKQLSMPVYSLSTNAVGDTGRQSMNIVTYASPVALKPAVYAIRLYKGTQSRENFKASGRGLLQILRRQHAPLLPLLGKQSARDVDKVAAVKGAGVGIVDRLGYSSISDCAGVMELHQMGDLLDAGDHEVALCSVARTQDVNVEGEVLYTMHLQEEGFI